LAKAALLIYHRGHGRIDDYNAVSNFPLMSPQPRHALRRHQLHDVRSPLLDGIAHLVLILEMIINLP
jgi:hypothetical protein